MLSTVTSSPFFRSPSLPLTPISVHRFRPSAVTQSAPSTCLYEVLRIPMGSSNKEIKAAYRRLARICHPDVAAESQADEFVKINAAYSTLSDPKKRADYDSRVFRGSHAYGGTGVATTPTEFYGYTYRKWETDQCW